MVVSLKIGGFVWAHGWVAMRCVYSLDALSPKARPSKSRHSLDWLGCSTSTYDPASAWPNSVARSVKFNEQNGIDNGIVERIILNGLVTVQPDEDGDRRHSDGSMLLPWQSIFCILLRKD